MNCSSAEALFERFLDDELVGLQRAAFVRHIDGCPECRAVLEELRMVDALLLTSRPVELAPNFTFATMAEARALAAPASSGTPHTPMRAYVVAYLAAAWLVAGAAFLFAPQTMHALARTLVDIARSIADAVGGLGTAVDRLFGRGGNVLTALLAALLVLDAALVAGVSLALKYLQPRLAERLRS